MLRIVTTMFRPQVFRMAEDGSGAGAPGENQEAGAGRNQSGSENNSGIPADNFADYWKPPQAPEGSRSAESANAAQQTSTSGEEKNPLDAFERHVNTLDFGQVMTPDIQAELADGNFDKFNTAIAGTLRNVVQQTVMMTARMIDAAGKTSKDETAKMIRGHLSSSDATKALHAAIPAAANPAIAPIAEGVMAQALRRSSGDTGKAIEMTKAFLTQMATVTGKDLGMTVVPTGQPGSGGLLSNAESGGEIDWLGDVFEMMKQEPGG